MLLMPREAATVDAAAALARANPFGPAHAAAIEALGLRAPRGPLWTDRTARTELAELLGPLIARLRARALRHDPAQHAMEWPSLDGLAATWLGVAAPEDPSALDLAWLGRSPHADRDALAAIRAARVGSVEAIARAWPGAAPAAQAWRAELWRAAWLGEPFWDIRSSPCVPPVPLVIWGPAGAPRAEVATLIAAADPWRTTDESGPMWRCHLPPLQIENVWATGPGLRFVDRLERASPDVQSALIAQVSLPSDDRPRWVFGATTGADLEQLDFELALRVRGAEIEIPSLPELLEADSLADYVDLVLAVAGVPDRSSRTEQVTGWIHHQVGENYSWPGHLAELARCVRARLLGQPFQQTRLPAWAPKEGLPAAFMAGLSEGGVDATTLLSRYCTWVYRQTGSYVATAARLGIDRRTVRKRIDRKLLARFGEASGEVRDEASPSDRPQRTGRATEMTDP